MKNHSLDQLDWLKVKIAQTIAWTEESVEEMKMGEVYPRIARVEELLAQLKKAAKLMNQGIEKLKKADEDSGIVDFVGSVFFFLDILLAMGKHLVEDGSWQRGVLMLRNVRDLFARFSDWQGQAQASVEIGDAHLLMGDYEVAKMSYLDAQRYLRKIADEAGLAVVQQKLGALALFMYQADEAEKQLKKAIAFFESHNDQKRAEVSRQLLQLAPEVRQTIPA